MYGALDISVSGMIAQRTRMDVIAANIANADATRDAKGNLSPYKRRTVHFAPGDPAARNEQGRSLGVHVAEIGQASSYRKRWDPGSPDAQTEGPDTGFVLVPDIDSTTEQVNSLVAQRAYEANIAAAEATKSMMAQALRLIA